MGTLFLRAKKYMRESTQNRNRAAHGKVVKIISKVNFPEMNFASNVDFEENIFYEIYKFSETLVFLFLDFIPLNIFVYLVFMKS